MPYQVIARKWRPQTFEDIVGQEHVTTTLRNSIANGRIGHAYLFTGIRGVGKTTAARVLAKALNCEHGPTPDPCNVCSACTEITNGSSMDVKEVDGASNRGIDSIRDLREGVAFAAARDRYKVYIIDEVHMLTTEAFNALLKTLEEPPAHVVFIFATTELHKVPPTIASRCQVFEFKRIPIPALVARLSKIAEAEGIHADEDAIRLISREADGSLRDACSLFDQVISFAAGDVTAADVSEILRTGDRAMLHGVLAAIVNEDAAEAVQALQAASERGTPARQFLRDLARFLAECIRVALLGADAGRETGLTEAEVAAMSAVAGSRPAEQLAMLLHLLVTAADKAADSRSPDLLALAALVRAARLSALTSVESMIGRLEALASGAGPLVQPGGGRPEQAPSRTTDDARRATGAWAVAPRPQPSPRPTDDARRTTPVAPAIPGTAVASVERLQHAMTTGSPAPRPAPASRDTAADDAVEDVMRRHPVVDKVLDMFGGQVLKVKADPGKPDGRGGST